MLRTGGIAPGTVIKFTDRGWSSGTCGTNGWAATVEEEIVFTTTQTLAYGTIISIEGLTATYYNGTPGTVTGTPLDLSSSGDQLFAYVGTQTGAYTLLAGIHMNQEAGTAASTWDNVGSPDATQSNKPACIVNGTHGLFINPEVGNAKLKSSVDISGNPATDRARVNNAANWAVSNSAEFSLLPVKFTSVNAYEKNGHIQIEWQAGTEESLKEYLVERSADGRNYIVAGIVAASGRDQYSFLDAPSTASKMYFRIKAVDLDGSFTFSKVLVINNSTSLNGMFVYPTIVTGDFNLQLANLTQGVYQARLYNLSGQLIQTYKLVHNGGSSIQTLVVPSGARGLHKIVIDKVGIATMMIR